MEGRLGALMWEILHEWKVGLFSFRTSLDRWTNRVIYSICGNTSRCFGVAFVACGLWSVEYDTQNLFTVCRDLDMPGWHVGTLVRIFLTFQPISMRLVFEQYSIVISRKVSLTESTYHHRTSQLGQSWWGFWATTLRPDFIPSIMTSPNGFEWSRP